MEIWLIMNLDYAHTDRSKRKVIIIPLLITRDKRR